MASPAVSTGNTPRLVADEEQAGLAAPLRTHGNAGGSGRNGVAVEISTAITKRLSVNGMKGVCSAIAVRTHLNVGQLTTISLLNPDSRQGPHSRPEKRPIKRPALKVWERMPERPVSSGLGSLMLQVRTTEIRLRFLQLRASIRPRTAVTGPMIVQLRYGILFTFEGW